MLTATRVSGQRYRDPLRVNEQTVQDFWQNHACGDALVGGLKERFGGDLANAERIGLGRYLRLREFTHYNTDGPANPYALVYDWRRIERDFPSFRIMKTYKRFMHAPPLPVHGLPGGGPLGWHLWAHLEPLDKKPADTSTPAEGFQAIPDRAES
jgi:hypothetical protein